MNKPSHKGILERLNAIFEELDKTPILAQEWEATMPLEGLSH
jgi:hypothetical protein